MQALFSEEPLISSWMSNRAAEMHIQRSTNDLKVNRWDLSTLGNLDNGNSSAGVLGPVLAIGATAEGFLVLIAL